MAVATRLITPGIRPATASSPFRTARLGRLRRVAIRVIRSVRETTRLAIGRRVRSYSSSGFVAAERPIHLDVGEHERLLVAIPGEADSGALAHRAVHAVGSDDISGFDGARAVSVRGDGQGDRVRVLPQ